MLKREGAAGRSDCEALRPRSFGPGALLGVNRRCASPAGHPPGAARGREDDTSSDHPRAAATICRARVYGGWRTRPRRLAPGVDPEAVLVLEDLDVELLDDVVGLREGLQAGVAAVQEIPGLAGQAVDSSLTFHAPFAPADERCASVYLSRERCSGKMLSLGAVAAGVRSGVGMRQEAETFPPALPPQPYRRDGAESFVAPRC